MSGWYKPILAVLAAAVSAVTLFSVGFVVGSNDDVRLPVLSSGETGGGSGDDILSEAYDQIVTSAVDRPDEEALIRGAIKGMVKVLQDSGDPYAAFYGRRSFEDFQELTTGEFSGIGVWLDVKDRRLVVLSVLPNSPARDEGLKPGDVVLEVDGDPVADMTPDEAVARIKGKAGTEVSLTIERDGRKFDQDITRAALEFPNLRSKLTRDDLGYIQLVSFARGAGKQLHDEVEDMIDRGAEGIILDMRDNGGGLFSEGIDVASVFLEDGVVTTYRSPAEELDYEAKGNAFEEVPLVVLVNGNTASAAEIVAGALQDNDRAILVGTTTFGKGSVQEVIPLSDASALKLTTAAYLTPDGSDINGEGIEPDVEVAGDDPTDQRSRAVEILKGIVLSGAGQG